MRSRVTSLFWRVGAILLLALGSVVAISAPANAAYYCSYGARTNTVGAFHPWYAWANCTGGTGYYQVHAACYSGGYMYPTGPVRRVGQGESRVSCVDYLKPINEWVVTWG